MNRLTWFPHDIVAGGDPFLEKAQEKFGHFGYACYWRLIETILKFGKADDLRLPPAKLCKELRSRRKQVQVYLDFCRVEGKINLDWTELEVRLTMPKLRERLAKMRSKMTAIFRELSPNMALDREKRREERDSLSESETVKEDETLESTESLTHGTNMGQDPGFMAFWAAYPQARRDRQRSAIIAWRALKPSNETQAKILVDLRIRKATSEWQRDNGKFIPLPVNYLNDHRWEDESSRGRLCEICGDRPVRSAKSHFCESCAHCTCGSTKAPFQVFKRADETKYLLCDSCRSKRAAPAGPVRINRKAAPKPASDFEEPFIPTQGETT